MDSAAGKTKMRALHIAPTPFFADRGCHIRIRNEIESIKDDVETVLCTYHHGREIASIKTFRIWKIPGYTNQGVGFSPFKFPADVCLFFLVLRVTLKFKPDVVHGHLHEGALIGWIVKTLLFWRKLSVVMDVQGSLYGELKAYKSFQKFPVILSLFKAIERFVYRLPDVFYCSSVKSTEFLQEDFHVPASRIFLLEDVVSYGCGPEYKNENKISIPNDKTTLVYSGSLLEGKGIEYLQDAMSDLLADTSDLFFLIIGYPVEAMEAFVAANNFESYCLLTGQLPYEDLLTCLDRADIAIEPKMNESGEASGKVLHYMAAGLPVVCFDTINNRNLVGEAGYFAESAGGGGASLAKSIRYALADLQGVKLKGKVGKEKILNHFSLEHCGQFLKNNYSQLVGADGRADM
jgi:glycosyltransferase involved in cell wall biosynthesis